MSVSVGSPAGGPSTQAQIQGGALVPANITLKDDSTTAKRPAHITIDVSFATPTRVGRIAFRNSYCASLTVRGTTERTVAARKEKDNLEGWHVLLKDHRLMEDAHVESDAQQWHALGARDLVAGAPDQPLVALRFFLTQPSVNWKTITLKNIAVWTFAPPLPAPPRETPALVKSKSVSQQVVGLSLLGQELFLACKAMGVQPWGPLAKGRKPGAS